MLSLIGSLTDQYLQENSVCYDLGCSLGAVSVLLSQTIQRTHTRIIALDNSQAMIDTLKAQLPSFKQLHLPIEARNENICDTQFEVCSVVIINLTLQFLAPEARNALIQKIYDALSPNGILIICDKIHFDQTDQQEQFRLWHEHFKRCQGYDELEISQKRAALMNVLQTDTPETHLQRLSHAGFSRVHTFYQALNFAGFIAVK